MREIQLFKVRMVALICMYAGLLFLIFGTISYVMFLIGIDLILIYLVLSFKYWQCPSCGKGFPIRHTEMDSASYCPFCKEDLNKLIPIDYTLKTNKELIALIIVNIIVLIFI